MLALPCQVSAKLIYCCCRIWVQDWHSAHKQAASRHRGCGAVAVSAALPNGIARNVVLTAYLPIAFSFRRLRPNTFTDSALLPAQHAISWMSTLEHAGSHTQHTPVATPLSGLKIQGPIPH